MQSLVPSVVLAAYAESLLDGRRAIVFGDSTSPLAEQLLERGARIVHVYDEDPGRVAEANAKNRSRNVSIAPLGEADSAVRDGAFDVAIIENLSTFGDPSHVIERAHRALSPRGAALFASPNPEGRRGLADGGEGARAPISYYDLYDSVSSQFEHVRMLGQAPFAGYAVVDFSHEGEPDVSIDTGFVARGAEEPEWFVALASERAVELEPYAIVQLPVAEEVAGPEPQASDEELERALEELRRAREALAETQAEAAGLRAAAERASRNDGAEQRLAEVRDELSRREEWIRELEARASAADARADQTLDEIERQRAAEVARLRAAESRVQELTAEVSALGSRERELASRSEQLTAENARIAAQLEALSNENQSQQLAAENARIAAQLEALSNENQSLQGEVEGLREQLEKVSRSEPSPTDDYAKLEAALKERGADVRRLEQALREAERIGRELVDESKRSGAGLAGGAALGLLAENARLTADLAAARWTLQELEDRLSK